MACLCTDRVKINEMRFRQVNTHTHTDLQWWSMVIIPKAGVCLWVCVHCAVKWGIESVWGGLRQSYFTDRMHYPIASQGRTLSHSSSRTHRLKSSPHTYRQCWELRILHIHMQTHALPLQHWSAGKAGHIPAVLFTVGLAGTLNTPLLKV